MLPHDEIPSHLPDLQAFWCQPTGNWKRQLAKLARRHLQQERIIDHAKHYHRVFFKTLREAGAQFSPDPSSISARDQVFECPCGRAFSSGQGLATHRRKAHGVFSVEHQFLQGATCPNCMRMFWTTQRLQQHLAYIPRKIGYNPCFHALSAQGYQVDYEAEALPRFVQGLQRVETIPVFGPHQNRLSLQDQARQDWISELEELQAEGDLFCIPPNADMEAADLCSSWTATTQQWFTDFVDKGYDANRIALLPDLWADHFVGYEDDYGVWLQATFLDWGDRTLPTILQLWEDGEAEPLVEEAYYTLVKDLPYFNNQSRMADLRRKLASSTIPEQEQPTPRPHRQPRAVNPNAKTTAQQFPEVIRAYAGQQAWHDALREVKWSCTPALPPLPVYKEVKAKVQLVVAHLFSGRRRADDFHAYLAEWAADRNCNVIVLSLDTAVSPHLGNLHHESVSWQKFIRLLRSGCIAGTMTGSPCETFSAARHHAPPDDAPPGTHWPRPLRSHARLFGLDKLKLKELRQLEQGSAFFLQVVEALCITILTGGCFVAEHPAIPSNPDFASTWRSAIIQLLLQHPACELLRVQQYRWGCSVRKPTGLLNYNIPNFATTMYAHAWDVPEPKQVAIGKEGDSSARQLTRSIRHNLGRLWHSRSVVAWRRS